MEEKSTIRILIVEDQPICRVGIRMSLEAAKDCQLIGEAENVAQAVAFLEKHGSTLLIKSCVDCLRIYTMPGV